jgi:hypothetical protein
MVDCSVIPPAFRSSISAPTCRRHGRRVRRSCYCRRCLSCSRMRREASCGLIRRCPIGCRTPSCRRSRRCGGRPANEHRLARRRRQVFLFFLADGASTAKGHFQGIIQNLVAGDRYTVSSPTIREALFSYRRRARVLVHEECLRMRRLDGSFHEILPC